MAENAIFRVLLCLDSHRQEIVCILSSYSCSEWIMDMEFDCEHRFLQAGIHSTPGSSHTDPWTLNIRLWTGGTE